MHADEVRAWGDLAGEVVARGAGHVQQVHRAVAARLFGAAGRVTAGAETPARLMHDGISTGVYAGVRHGGRVAARGAARLARWAWPHRTRGGLASPVAATAQATVVGLIGDQLAEAGSEVAWPLRLRCQGADVPIAPRALQEAYPEATDRLLVFVPGLFETEHAWRYRAERLWGDADSTHGTRFAADGWTSLDVRHPSGQSLADNGRELAELLRRVVATWPAEVSRIAIVGHSMGGLIARHAVHHATGEGHEWVKRCSDVVCLGSPHGGSPVARGAAASARSLVAVPETAGIGDIIELRSVGIRDLEITDAVPDVDGVDVHAVVAVLSSRPGRIAQEVVGDLLVGSSSAGGVAGDGSRVRLATTRTFTGLHHFDLLNHPAVFAHLRQVLDGRLRRARRRAVSA